MQWMIMCVLYEGAAYLAVLKTLLWFFFFFFFFFLFVFFNLQIIRRADYRAEITVELKKKKNSHL